jgi:hypothetical protein
MMIHHHVILEGPDGSGKTVLARRLEALGYEYRHEGPPPADTPAFEHYARLFVDAERPTVFDRFHLGELVYGPLLRGISGLDHSDMVRLTSLIQGAGTPIVFCYPPWSVCLLNTLNRKELITNKNTLASAYLQWATVVERYPANVQAYDYTQDRFHMAQYPRTLPRFRSEYVGH